MHNQPAKSDLPLTITLAKKLNHKRHQPYKILTDHHALEWLVDFVCDNGRFISLIMAGTHGRVLRSIGPPEYHNYTITLGPEDL